MNEKKEKIQRQAVEIFAEEKAVALEWATGTGKTRAAILCMEYWLERSKTKWYIVCEEVQHINNWKEEFKTHGKENLLEHVEIFCYASLHKYRDTQANLILDEAHVASDLRVDILKSIKFEKIVILSATLPYERKVLIRTFVDFVSFEITLKDSIDMKLLPEPRIYKVELALDNAGVKYVYTYKRGYGQKPIEMSCTFTEFDAVLSKMREVRSFAIHVRCTARQYYTMATRDMEDWRVQWKEHGSRYMLNNYLQKGSARKKFVADYKTPYVRHILGKIEGLRSICFCGSVKQADELGGTLAVHSEISGNEKIVQSFNNHEINKIFAVKMLRSGVNLAGIQAGIITQLDSKSLSFVQMVGRVFRSDDPILYVLVAKGTNDERYFETCLEGFDTKYLETLDFNDKQRRIRT